MQFLGYNADLYDNYTSASWHPNGLVGLSVLVQIGQMSNIELRKITDAAASVPYRGKHITLHGSGSEWSGTTSDNCFISNKINEN